MAHTAEGQPGWPQLIAVAIYTGVFGFIWWLNEAYAVGKLRHDAGAGQHNLIGGVAGFDQLVDALLRDESTHEQDERLVRRQSVPHLRLGDGLGLSRAEVRRVDTVVGDQDFLCGYAVDGEEARHYRVVDRDPPGPAPEP